MGAKEKKPKPKSTETERKWIDVLFIAFILLTLSVAGLLIILFSPSLVDMPYVFTPLIVIFGVTTLLSSLAVVAVILSYLRLTDSMEALGLPRGSIRALIALSLIVIFAIMVVFMYQQLAATPLQYENGTYVTDPNNTVIFTEISESQIDFAKQVLTTVSTLVVAVAGFYFGTQAVHVAKGTEEKPLLVINPSGSRELEQGNTLKISVETFPENEKINCRIDNPSKGSIVLEDGDFSFKPSTDCKPEDKINLTFTMAKHADVSKQLEITIIEKKPET